MAENARTFTHPLPISRAWSNPVRPNQVPDDDHAGS